ncbi:MAG: dependent epimerase/dehydratase family protein [Segetibacter sp.]|nr:dependent epimerase/dehydratase family protein [Segetibacter sp.]
MNHHIPNACNQNKNSKNLILQPQPKLFMQTILGATGPIGTELAKELIRYTDKIRLVSRNPKKVNATDILLPADLTKAEDVDKAIAGSQIVYLTVGFEYNIKVWKRTWPALMRNVIEACKKYNCKLVFFDNVYMYDRDFLSDMTEETPVRPTSKKGEIRAEIAELLLSETKKGSLTALIARSADFLGPNNSVLIETVYKNFKKGKKANWFADANKVHNFTFYSDAAKGTAILGNSPEAYNQVWHLPTDKIRLTGKQWIELFARQVNVKPAYMVVPAWLAGILGLFVPIMKELKEMMYQYDRDYFFNSSKFEKAFNYKPIAPEEAVRIMCEL